MYILWQVSATSIDTSIFGLWLTTKLADLTMSVTQNGHIGTPPSIAKLMTELADAPDNASIFDPCCGIGTILARAVERSRGAQAKVQVFGQELFTANWALCKLRLFFLAQDTTSIAPGDCLRQPAFVHGDRVQTFDRVFCDAPMGSSLRDSGLPDGDQFHRFVYGMPGRSSADSAFVQHAVASMKPDGRAILLLSHGFLFRGGVDARVREGLVRSYLVQAVIGLPAKLLPTTAIETALLVLGKNETGKILFIDGTTLQPPARGKAELSQKFIEKILKIFHSKAETTGVSRLVGLHDLSGESDLHPRRYISTPHEHVAPVDTQELWAEARSLEANARATAEAMDDLLQQIAKA